jgi:hypothetical protein
MSMLAALGSKVACAPAPTRDREVVAGETTTSAAAERRAKNRTGVVRPVSRTLAATAIPCPRDLTQRI